MVNIKKITRGAHLLKIVFRKYTWRFFGMAVMGILAGLSGSIGIGAAIPMFSLLTSQSFAETDFISNFLEKTFTFLHLPFTPTFLIAFIVFLFFAKAIVQFTAKYVNEWTAAQFEEDLRNDLYKHTLGARWQYLVNQKIGYQERILLYDIQKTGDILTQMNSALLLATSLLTYALVAFNISISITLITLGIGVVIFFIYKPLFYKTRKMSALIGETYRQANHALSEHIIGAKLAKASGIESSLLENARILFKRLRETRLKTIIYGNLAGGFIEPIGFILIALIFISTYKNPSFNIAAFAVVVYLIQKMFSFIQSFQSQLHGISELIPYLETVFKYRNAVILEKDIVYGTKAFDYKDKIKFENVSFAYNNRDLTLKNISFEIEKGSTLAITGSSGNGKTTLADLILRLIEPTSGKISIDGTNISEIDIKSWRNAIAYVPQEIFLINGTVEQNIRYFDNSISQKDIEEASKVANIYTTIQNLPEKFETQVGERGMKLSGGQRQRLALARALARHPQILVLDEATSALDNESEKFIQEALAKLHGKVTIIVIAHRDSSIAGADKIITLANGKVHTRQNTVQS